MDTDHDRDHQTLITITGEKVALGPLHRGIIPLMLKWDNDLALSILSGDPARPRTVEAAEAEYESYAKGEGGDWVLFVVYERERLRPIGIAELSDIDRTNRTAEYGIRIGEGDYWGRGYGTEVTYLMLDYAFNALGLHNVALEVHAFNGRAIRAYEKVGFREIGRRRQAHRIGDRAYDEVLMDCIAPEFRSPLDPVVELP